MSHFVQSWCWRCHGGQRSLVSHLLVDHESMSNNPAKKWDVLHNLKHNRTQDCAELWACVGSYFYTDLRSALFFPNSWGWDYIRDMSSGPWYYSQCWFVCILQKESKCVQGPRQQGSRNPPGCLGCNGDPSCPSHDPHSLFPPRYTLEPKQRGRKMRTRSERFVRVSSFINNKNITTT